MSYTMSPAEREQFLTQPHVGVLSVVENGAPLTVPVWYGYQLGGRVRVITGPESRKARALQAIAPCPPPGRVPPAPCAAVPELEAGMPTVA